MGKRISNIKTTGSLPKDIWENLDPMDTGNTMLSHTLSPSGDAHFTVACSGPVC